MNKIEKIAEDIKSGRYPKQKIKLQQFFRTTVLGEKIPDRERRIQVRDVDRDIDRVNRAVNKIQKDGDKSGLEPLTTITFVDLPEKILNGNHTSEIMAILGEDEAETYRVDFEKDLDSKESNCLMLGNLLNKIPVEKVDVHENDIKRELYQIMDERAEEGLDPKPPEEELQALCNRYPHVSRATIGQWISNRSDVGGRRETLRTYTAGELHAFARSLENMEIYKDYAVLEPRQLRSWTDTGIEQAFKQMKNQQKKKALMPLFCRNRAQQDQWEQTDIQSRIKKEFFELGQYWDCTIEFTMMRYE